MVQHLHFRILKFPLRTHFFFFTGLLLILLRCVWSSVSTMKGLWFFNLAGWGKTTSHTLTSEKSNAQVYTIHIIPSISCYWWRRILCVRWNSGLEEAALLGAKVGAWFELCQEFVSDWTCSGHEFHFGFQKVSSSAQDASQEHIHNTYN